ncbi:protein-L-isoaspartate(D-aspartate) O-methyltransferase [Pseudovibrio sp. FO-BEG1]|uniref:Protein-L-isoaspartate O-methyltransferase n=1 Tax=Pseudovibrio brasiliensis TaxID=1898042 RepID=A0ABX8AGI8_9HYPH|nr:MULTISPECIES: protein-L-isoaspartate O-methyltransferase [Pseudovibrio]AEV37991.1 protein-L-isoaspartate(D-aspartate) O-methyltransferase [Pseudovibrio sp. FO-BEG1]EEA96392.1 protein-L-isoaspartate O-methyltransferase protein [Pseudovibrio sp. JE062]QUS54183.1 protein-L-isoaspartate O-methyltransferase [Pseudovibrio brasiliensis]
MVNFAEQRTLMVDNQLRTNDITDLRIIGAMGKVPREKFVPENQQELAYIDEDVSVDENGERKMLKPHIFGRLVQLADITDKDVVLVVGAASGYGVAVVSYLAESVVGLEVDVALSEAASANLEQLGIENAAVIDGDLAKGYAADAPYDVILVNGSVEQLPEALTAQMKDEGRLVVVEGESNAGVAKLYTKSGGNVSSRFAFNAHASALPGFEKPEVFEF